MINGGAGTDSLSATISADYDGDTTISNVENFLVRATAAKYFDMNGQSGVETIQNDRSSADLEIKSVASAATTIVVDRMTSGKDMNVGYQTAALTGDTTVNVDLESVAVSGTASEVNLYGAAGTTDGIETLNVSGNGSGASYLQILSVAATAAGTTTMTKLVMDGAQTVTVTDALDFKGNEAAENVSTVDASASTGGVSLAFLTGEMVSVTGGSGNDTFTFTDAAGATANLTTKDTVAGGTGTDTLKIDQSANTAGITSVALKSMNLTGIEVIQYEGDDAQNVTLTTDGLTDLTTLNLVENNTDAKNFSVTDLAAGVGVGLINNVDGGNHGIGVVTLGLKDASGTADALTVTLKGTSGHDSTDGNDVADLAFSNIETLSLVSSMSGTTAFTSTDANVIADISSDSTLTTINASGAQALQFTVGGEATNLSTINASAATGAVTVTASTGNLAVTGGSGNDTINLGTSLKNSDTIDGGAGTADVVTATINGLTATTGALHISNVENVRLDTSGASSTINATAITGATVLGFASAQNVTVTGLAAGTKIGLGYDATDDDYSGTLDVSLADATGTADTITFATVDSDANNSVNATLKVASTVETTALSIAADTDAGTDNDVTLSVANVKSATISISGGTSTEVLALGTLSTATSTVDASAFDGILSATASATATTFTLDGDVLHDVTGGAGNDTITVSSTAVNQNVDGGAGTDTLNMTLGGTVVATNIANFETVNFTVGASKAGVFTVATGTGINDNDTKTVTITGGNSLSTMAIGATGANAIGIADGSEATGLTSINATGFLGAMTLTFGDNVLDTNLTITGGSGNDTVKGTFDAADVTLSMTAVENLYIESDGTADVDFSATTGLTTVYVDDDNTAAATTLTDLISGVKVDLTTGASGSTLTVDLKDKTATDNALTINLTAITTTASLLIDDVETLTLDVDAASTLDMSAVQMTTASKVSSLVLTGAAALRINALNADVTTIDGSGFSTGGALNMQGRSATTAMTITTAAGDDTIIMKNGSDVLTAGEGTDSLVITAHNVLGGIAIDLSSTTDQITTYNGSANSIVQSGFENVDLSGLTGTSGAEVTAHSDGSTITGTANADVINGGAGVDSITGGGGIDIITLGDGADDVVLSLSVDGNNYDQITGFTTTSDDIFAAQATFGWNSTDNTTTVLLATGATLKAADVAGDSNIMTISANVATDTYVTFLAGTSTYAALETAAATAMGATGALDAAAVVLVAIDDGTHTGLWKFTSGDAATDDATDVAEIELIGILKDVSDATSLVVGDFLFS